MRKTKMALAAFSALFFAVSGNFTAIAAVPSAVIQPFPETESTGTSVQADSPEAGQPAEVPQPSTGEQIAAYAAQFIGNPYVYGGTSLTGGADCSGFVMKVYEQFGVPLPRTSGAQGRVGMDVGGIENAQPGDIISYKGHIGIYQGQNQLVHASNAQEGIKVSPVNYKPILSVRRMV